MLSGAGRIRFRIPFGGGRLPQRLLDAHERGDIAGRPLDVVRLRPRAHPLPELRERQSVAAQLLELSGPDPGRMDEGVHGQRDDGRSARLRRRHRSRAWLLRQLLRALPQQHGALGLRGPSVPQRVHERHDPLRDRHPPSVRVGQHGRSDPRRARPARVPQVHGSRLEHETRQHQIPVPVRRVLGWERQEQVGVPILLPRGGANQDALSRQERRQLRVQRPLVPLARVREPGRAARQLLCLGRRREPAGRTERAGRRHRHAHRRETFSATR